MAAGDSTLENEETPAEAYSAALELAYPIAVESYKQAERRFEVVEKRLQELLAFAVTVTVGILAVCAGKVDFRSTPFILSIVCFAVGIIIGIWARLSGHIVLISPEVLFDKYLTKSEAEFQLDFVFWAGQNDKENSKRIYKKANLTNWVALCFLLEALFLSIWAFSVIRSPAPPTPPSARSISFPSPK